MKNPSSLLFAPTAATTSSPRQHLESSSIGLLKNALQRTPTITITKMSSPTDPGFNPYTQNITMYMPDGTPIIVSLADIDMYSWYNVACSINYGAQAGGCGVMFFVVLVLSKAKKRQTPIFIFNILSLIFGFIRCLTASLYFLSSWAKLYPYYSGDFNAIPQSAYASSVIATIIPLFMTLTVNLSLVLQSHTVCRGMIPLHRYTIIGLSSIVFLVAVAFRFLEAVTNSMAIVSATSFSEIWIPKAVLYTETISIWFFSLIFTVKLIFTLHYRRRNGWKQWSGVRILAAMGGCTMLIPCKYYHSKLRTALIFHSLFCHSRVYQRKCPAEFP
jgi:pheromone alpha factor receptor